MQKSANRFNNMEIKNLFLKEINKNFFRNNQYIAKYLEEMWNRNTENTHTLVRLGNTC